MVVLSPAFIVLFVSLGSLGAEVGLVLAFRERARRPLPFEEV
jgi:hypothetical protein